MAFGGPLPKYASLMAASPGAEHLPAQPGPSERSADSSFPFAAEEGRPRGVVWEAKDLNAFGPCTEGRGVIISILNPELFLKVLSVLKEEIKVCHLNLQPKS